MQKMQNFKEKTDSGMITDKLGYNIPKIIICLHIYRCLRLHN
jgi:hypothetical protein